MNPNPDVSLFPRLSLLALIAAAGPVPLHGLTLELQRRDPATGAVTIQTESVDPRHFGVIAVDVWNYHWCKTATMRVDAIVPRLNRALEAARDLGMTVMLCPSDVVDNYVGYPSVVFKVFLDGVEAAASPVMRVLSPAWRFDVPIPEGAKRISLVAMDAGDGSREDFADWANAGFVVRNGE